MSVLLKYHQRGVHLREGRGPETRTHAEIGHGRAPTQQKFTALLSSKAPTTCGALREASIWMTAFHSLGHRRDELHDLASKMNILKMKPKDTKMKPTSDQYPKTSRPLLCSLRGS
ncbi:unnamed protein product [Boreogadus saida]